MEVAVLHLVLAEAAEGQDGALAEAAEALAEAEALTEAAVQRMGEGLAAPARAASGR